MKAEKIRLNQPTDDVLAVNGKKLKLFFKIK